jgi:hypothetical protein
MPTPSKQPGHGPEFSTVFMVSTTAIGSFADYPGLKNDLSFH